MEDRLPGAGQPPAETKACTVDDNSAGKPNAGHVTAGGSVVRAGGWIMALVIVGLWIGIGQLWQRDEPQRPLVEAAYTVDINQANEMDLLNLPEVGPTLAGNIMSYRAQYGDFRSLSDLGEVPGVGPQTLKQLAPFLSFVTAPDTATPDTAARDTAARDTAH